MSRLIDADEAKRIAREDLTDPYHVISACAVLDKTPTITPQNEPLTLEQIKSLYDSPAWYQDLYRKMGYWVIVGAIGEIGVHLTDLDNANEFYSTIDYGARWALFRRPPERQEDA